MEIRNNNKVFGKIDGDKIIFTRGIDLNEMLEDFAGTLAPERDGDVINFIETKPTIEEKIRLLRLLGFEVK